MGIYDREYYRREGPSFLGSFGNTGRACKWLILASLVLFVLQVVSTQRPQPNVDDPYDDEPATRVQDRPASPVTDVLQMDTRAVLHGQVWRLLTYAFLHDPNSWMHILFNMLFLWWFGSDVEDLYGTKEFLTFYLLAALLGGVAFEAAWLAGMRNAVYCVGASGAVTAVMVLCALHYPTRTIYVWFVPVPIWLFVLFQVGRDAMTLLSGVPTTTAVTVHLAGAAFAFAYYKGQFRLSPWLTGWRSLAVRRTRPQLRVYREEPAEPVRAVAPAPAVGGASEVDEQLEAKLDAVLEKVARHGKDSLTDGERQVLLRASEVYKKRRS